MDRYAGNGTVNAPFVLDEDPPAPTIPTPSAKLPRRQSTLTGWLRLPNKLKIESTAVLEDEDVKPLPNALSSEKKDSAVRDSSAVREQDVADHKPKLHWHQIARAEVDQDKEAVQNLSYKNSTPAARKAQQRWYNEFLGYRKEVLGIPDGSMPDGEEIKIFFNAYLRLRAKSNHLDIKGNPLTMQFRTAQQGLDYIFREAGFRHASFVVPQNFRAQMLSIFETAVEKGLLTHTPTREPMRVGCRMVLDISKRFLHDRIENGTWSWDVLIWRVSHLVFLNAFGTRAGDMAVSHGYADLDGDLPCIRWRDVSVRMSQDKKVHMKIVLRYTKGKKDDPSDNEEHTLTQLPDEFASICPIRFILVMALRVGAVEHKSSEVLFSHLESVGHLSWTTPDNPLLPAFSVHGIRLVTDKPALTDQIRGTLKYARDIFGFLQPPTPHDVRRGVARDAAHVGSLSGTNLANAAEILGHSHSQRHITRMYRGSIVTDHLLKRLQEAPVFIFDDDMLADSAYKHKRLRTEDVDQACEDLDLDSHSLNDRHIANHRHKRQRRDEWSKTVAVKSSLDSVNVGSIKSEDSRGEGNDLDDQSASSLTGLKTREPAVLTGTLHEFVDHFSRVNVYKRVDQRYEKTGQDPYAPESLHFIPEHGFFGKELVQYVDDGNSRDKSSVFKYPCEQPGCPYEATAQHILELHRPNCPYDPSNDKTPVTQNFRCEKCLRWFSTQGSYDTHQSESHTNGLPCYVCGKPFVNAKQRSNYIVRHHGDLNKKCPVEGCKSKKVWPSQGQFVKHVEEVHKLTKDEAKALLDA